MSDLRYRLTRERLLSLTHIERQRITDNTDRMCFDEFNYADGKFCPLAIALNLHNTLENPTDEKVTQILAERFTPVNILKGTPGTFYTENRKTDLLNLCHELKNQI